MRLRMRQMCLNVGEMCHRTLFHTLSHIKIVHKVAAKATIHQWIWNLHTENSSKMNAEEDLIQSFIYNLRMQSNRELKWSPNENDEAAQTRDDATA